MRAALALALLLLAGTAAAQGVDHPCGTTPRAITVREMIPCPCSGPAPELLDDGSYMVRQTCAPMVCYATVIEWWTDWPECPGASRMQSLSVGYWGRSITGDDLPIAYPPDPEPPPEETP
jgi:hypothetical protein